MGAVEVPAILGIGGNGKRLGFATALINPPPPPPPPTTHLNTHPPSPTTDMKSITGTKKSLGKTSETRPLEELSLTHWWMKSTSCTTRRMADSIWGGVRLG